MTINHLHLKVTDIQKSIAFYSSIFGFKEKVKFSDDFYFLQDSAQFDLALVQLKEVKALPEGVHFGVALKTREEVVGLLEKMKAQYPSLLLDSTLNDKGTWGDFNCTDPDGYPIPVYWDVNLHSERS